VFIQCATFQTWITFTLRKRYVHQKLRCSATRMHGVTTHKTKIRVPTSVKTNTLIDIFAFVISLLNPDSSGVLGVRRGVGVVVEDNSYGYSAILRNPGQKLHESETSVIRHYTVRRDIAQLRHGASHTAPCCLPQGAPCICSFLESAYESSSLLILSNTPANHNFSLSLCL